MISLQNCKTNTLSPRTKYAVVSLESNKYDNTDVFCRENTDSSLSILDRKINLTLILILKNFT